MFLLAGLFPVVVVFPALFPVATDLSNFLGDFVILCEILCNSITSGSSGGSGDSEHPDIRKTVGDLLDSTYA